MSTGSSLLPETRFGQYRIVRLLGRGGMGEVYEAEHTTLERRYALKLLPPDFAARPEAIVRFRREARVMANLNHPHIVNVDEFGETDGRYWLRMELVHGVVIGSKAESGKQKAEIGSAGARCITLGDYAVTRPAATARQCRLFWELSRHFVSGRPPRDWHLTATIPNLVPRRAGIHGCCSSRGSARWRVIDLR